MVESVRTVEGDIVECGVSLGHGALLFTLFSDHIGTPRKYYGFDSIEGFPDPVEKDEITPIKGKGFWANPSDTVLKVLRDGRLGEEVIRERIRLVKGWFDKTLPSYKGRIALLHLDCDLYESYKISLETLYDKVQHGGVIMFDEYGDARWPGATKAIDEFFYDKSEKVQPHPKCTWKYHVMNSELLLMSRMIGLAPAIEPECRETILVAKDRMIRHVNWMRVYQPLKTSYMLRRFDLTADPVCLRDEAAAHPDIQAALWQQLRHLLNAPLAHFLHA